MSKVRKTNRHHRGKKYKYVKKPGGCVLVIVGQDGRSPGAFDSDGRLSVNQGVRTVTLSTARVARLVAN